MKFSTIVIMVKKFKRSVLLTGAAGFLGKSMVKVYLAEGYHVIATDINEAEMKKLEPLGGDLELVKIDMLKEDLVPLFKRVVEEAEEPYIVNIAGLFKFDAPAMSLFLINVRLTKNVMDAALKVGGWKHIVHISTVGTYGTPANNRKTSWYLDYEPYKENEPQIPDNTYGVTKYMGENCAWRYYRRGLPISIVRPSLIYGPENRYGMGLFLHLASYTRNIMRGPMKYIMMLPMAIPCRTPTYASFVHVEDISRASALILSKPESIGEAYTVATPKAMDTISFFTLMHHCERVKIDWRLVPFSKFLIQHYDSIFTAQTTKLFERIFRVLFKMYEWHMHYDSSQIPLEISKDWLGYFKSNYIWDTSKLKALGFQWKYPNLKRGVIENVIWYKKNKWLP